MAWEENSRICLHMQLIAILSRTGVLYNKTAYRLFAFWDKDKETLVIATHGIIKKTQKTPSKEIAKAEAIRREYFKNK